MEWISSYSRSWKQRQIDATPRPGLIDRHYCAHLSLNSANLVWLARRALLRARGSTNRRSLEPPVTNRTNRLAAAASASHITPPKGQAGGRKIQMDRLRGSQREVGGREGRSAWSVDCIPVDECPERASRASVDCLKQRATFANLGRGRAEKGRRGERGSM